MNEDKLFVVIPAAGMGERFQNESNPLSRPKQYRLLANKPILAYTLDLFLQEESIQKIIIALSPEDGYFNEYFDPQNYPMLKTVIGGDTRYQSVMNALYTLKGIAAPQDWVLVHDAVRPCLSKRDFHQLLNSVQQHPVGAILAEKMVATVKLADSQNRILKTLPRDKLWQALTPQMFRYELLFEALQNALNVGMPITDEAEAIEAMGYMPLLVEATDLNPKLTQVKDLKLIASLLSDPEETAL